MHRRPYFNLALCLEQLKLYDFFIARNMMNHSLSYFHISWLSETDGPGKRLVLFLQGCPLDCAWCHSPHSQPKVSPILWFETRCSGCQTCASVCPHDVHQFRNNQHTLQRQHCTQCGRCIEACPNSSVYTMGGALALPTRVSSVNALFEKLSPHLELLGKQGGITFSGGEPLAQAEAVAYLAQKCKEAGFHTALETSGIVSPASISKVLPWIDTWLFGLRLNTGTRTFDTNFLFQKTRESLKIITQNKAAQIIVRIPAIPVLVANPQFMDRAVELLLQFNLNQVEVLRHNPESDHFYHALGIKPQVDYQAFDAEKAYQFIQFILNNHIQKQCNHETSITAHS